ncbi:MAG: SAM-dependent methyltransferase, partial [Bacteroidota bacterium]
MQEVDANTLNDFSQSVIWDWQSHYFREKGIEAWRTKEVPHYVTSNPTIANTYAKLFRAFRQDRVNFKGTDRLAPVTICELGAGSGAFAFHFIQRMIALCEIAGEKPTSVFKYVLTDISEKTISFWLDHPRFQPWLESGVLDVAYFDVLSETEISLQVSKEKLVPGTLEEPLLIIGNYLFDSIPQEMFHFSNGQLDACQVTYSFPEQGENLSEVEKLARFQPHYTYRKTSTPLYSDNHLNKVIRDYQRELQSGHILFPVQGWEVVQRLRALSKSGAFVLGVDKGTIALEQLEQHPIPEIQQHGSISMPVNIHALARLTEETDGMALLPQSRIWDFNIFGLLLTDSDKYTLLKATYIKNVERDNPYDFYQTAANKRKDIDAMTFEEILSFTERSRYDVMQFVFFLPKLIKEAPFLSLNNGQVLSETIDKVWEAHYPLGEELAIIKTQKGGFFY